MAKTLKERLQELMSEVGFLPPIPAVATQLMGLINRPPEQVDVAKVSDLVSTDPSLAARVVGVANSSYYATKTQVTGVKQAILNIGVVEALEVLNASVLRRKALNFREPDFFSLDRFMAHSCACGKAARLLARAQKAPKHTPEELYLAGLLHDFGKAILACRLPDEFRRARALAQEKAIPLCEAESEALGVDHGMVGGYLLTAWKVPPLVAECAVSHHDPEGALPAYREAAAIVEFSNLIAKAAALDDDTDPAPCALEETDVHRMCAAGEFEFTCARTPADIHQEGVDFLCGRSKYLASASSFAQVQNP